MSESLHALLLALADDELVLGHRHSEWTGFAPHIEEDVAFSSIAQDEIGHAAAYYGIAAQLSGDNPDRLALGRDKDDYRHAQFCERDNGDWAYTIARQWLYDHADDVRLEILAGSAHRGLASLAAKLRREERYHLIHADTWLRRIAHGPVQGRSRLISAMGQALPDSLALFEPIEIEDRAVSEGWLPLSSTQMGSSFLERTLEALDELGLPGEAHGDLDRSAEFVASASGDLIAAEGPDSNDAPRPGYGGRRGVHSPDFAALWDVMTSQYRVEPEAAW